MIKNFNIIGKIKNKGNYSINTEDSITNILKYINFKMENNEKLFAVQIGGVLGDIIFKDEFNNSMRNYLKDFSTNHIMIFGNLFCPVDYLRFLSRFFIRELNLTKESIYNFNEWIEEISQGKGSFKNGFSIINSLEDSFPEKRLKDISLKIIELFKEDFIEHIKYKTCTNGICRPLFKAQCINACPSNVNIPGYIALIKNRDYLNAYKLMKQDNPFSFVCGKICSRPCESRCRRNEIENTVGVRALQKFASEKSIKFFNLSEEKLPLNGKKIAIIGAGPSGLSAAYYLQKNGYQVDIYEAESFAGGALISSIPDFKLNKNDVFLEIDSIIKLGVNIYYNHKVGTNISIEYIKNKYDSTIIATGAPIGKHIFSTTNNFIFTALDFLKKVKNKKLKNLKEKTIIIGGGDVAIDTARTALRLGSTDVTIVSIEEFDDLPATWNETLLALAEGVQFKSGYDLHSIEHNDVFSLTLTKTLSSHNLKGEFNPNFNKLDTVKINSDHVILAIGQQSDLSFLNTLNINKNKYNSLIINSKTFETSIENIYAIGDVVKTGSAIDAISQGKNLAAYLHNLNFSKELFIGNKIDIPITKTDIRTWDFRKREELIIPPKNLYDNFQEIVHTYSIEDAHHEANRCLRCDLNSNAPLFLRKFNIKK